jgi:hypothetical protein
MVWSPEVLIEKVAYCVLRYGRSPFLESLMPLPPALLQLVEQHGCVSGCYGSSSNLQAFITSAAPPAPMVSVTCLDCLGHVGVLASLLPTGMYSYQLADQLSQHVRALRGYSLSVSGYHTNGPGFWLSAVHWASCNMFLVCGDRSRSLGSDLDLLMLAFQHGVLKPSSPGMLAPASFTVQPLYHDAQQAMPVVTVKADLLTATGISTQPVKGWKELTLAEYVGPANPNSTVAPRPGATPATAVAVPAPGIGQRCPKCGAEIRQRSLLNQTYFGCMC